jgi:hypothetical protein
MPKYEIYLKKTSRGKIKVEATTEIEAMDMALDNDTEKRQLINWDTPTVEITDTIPIQT